ncbi:MAG: diphthine synthase, partial [Methanomassiliicoccaceae archaeon]|nr:diphthine synthase [Methanomassiliicoccaceae archaeon]
NAARTSRAGFVTAGDTMAATTHVDLLIQAAEEGIPTKVYHGVSIFSACPTSLGLQPYKFGRTVTLPFIDDGYHPRSPYDHLVTNRNEGLHSMVLLDIRADEMRYMSAHQAIEWLLEAERKWNCGLVTDETIICVASRIGSDSEKVFAGYPRDLLAMNLGEPLHTLVIPGQLHFMESYALVHLAGAPETIIKDD